jgi:hypothetical protein
VGSGFEQTHGGPGVVIDVVLEHLGRNSHKAIG